MHKGIYIAISSAVLKQAQLDIIAQNLANANTVGYKREYVTFSDYLISEGIVVSDDKIMTNFNKVVYDFTRGELVKTDKPLDIAIEGDGFIALEGNRYTRRGDLNIDDEGYLVNFKGIRVLGEDGFIYVGKGVVPKIKSDGTVVVDEKEVGKIKIVNFDRLEDLKKTDSTIFFTTQEEKEAEVNIISGYLEASNVNSVYEMITMIEVLRDFESYQKAVQIFDESVNKVVNDIARI